jgi:hypothetical protein
MLGQLAGLGNRAQQGDDQGRRVAQRVQQSDLPIAGKKLTVLVVSWSAGELSICESNSSELVEANRRLPFFRRSCSRPDFFEEIRSMIKSSGASVVAITTQHEANSSYFHSEYLPHVLGELNYVRLKIDPYKYTGSGGSTLRLSIYTDASISAKVTSVKYKFKHVDGGAIISYVQLQDTEMAFVACQAGDISPFYKEEDLDILDHDSLHAANVAVDLIQMLSRTVHRRDTQTYYLMGDFGTSVTVPDWTANDIIESIRQNGTGDWVSFDTMTLIKQFPSLSLLKEGVGDVGRPSFGPVFPLSERRGASCLGDRMGSSCFAPLEDRVGWPCRILYTGPTIYCSHYSRLNSGTIAHSDTDLIYSIFTL